MKGICLSFANPDLFFRCLKELCHGNQYFGKVGELTFIQHAGVPKWIAVSQLQFKNIQRKYFIYIL